MRKVSNRLMAGLALASALVLSGCAGSMMDEPVISDTASFHAARQIEVLKPGQDVRLVVFGVDDLTGIYKVSDSGRLKLPGMGTIEVAGMTPTELEQLVTEKLVNAGKDAQVSVMLD